jgi:hypothetical protein
MRLGRVGYLVASLGVALLFAAASASAATAHARHAFKVLISPEYATAGQPTNFQVKFVNTSSRGVSLGALQITPPKGFGLMQTTLPGGLKHKGSRHQRTFALHRLALKPGKSVQIQVSADAPAQCGKRAVRWTSHAFGRGNATGPQLALQSAASSIGVTVLCPATAACGDGGPPCSTGLSTSPSTYAVVSDAGSGTLNETVNVGKRLSCAGYKLRDSNWYDSLVTGAQPSPAGTPPITDQITYTITNAHSDGIGFCLGATYDFTTASGSLAPKATLPSGAPGFVGLLPMCADSKPPCISSINESSDDSVKSGVDTTLSVLIPEQGDPWGAG